MWVLNNTKQPGQKYYVIVGKDTIVGRKETTILIIDDQSISRKHSVLSVSHAEANLPYVQRPAIFTLKDFSKYGTFINGKKVESGSTTQLKDGDKIIFGSLKTNEWKVGYEPTVVCSSCLDSPDKKSLKAVLVKLGGHFVSEWTKDCNFLVMSKLNVTVKVISALITCHPMVKPQYFYKVLEAVETNSDLPAMKEYLPPLTDMAIKRDSVSFTADERRKVIFQDMTFIFLSPKQFKRLNQTISFGNGRAILMEEGSDDDNDDVLIQPGTCVMHADPTDHTQKYSQNGKEWISHVMKFLKSNDLRAIQDSELGMAVLHTSCELHCNPKISQAGVNLLQPLPSQTLESQQVLATETEPSQAHYATQKAEPSQAHYATQKAEPSQAHYATQKAEPSQAHYATQKGFTVPSTSESATSGRQRRAQIKQERISGDQRPMVSGYSESLNVSETASNVSKISETVLSVGNDKDKIKTKSSPKKGNTTSYFGTSSKKRVREEEEGSKLAKQSKIKLTKHDTYEFQSQTTQLEHQSPKIQRRKIKQEVTSPGQEVTSPDQEVQNEIADHQEKDVEPVNTISKENKVKPEVVNRAPSPIETITTEEHDDGNKISAKVRRKRKDFNDDSDDDLEESQWSKRRNVRERVYDKPVSQSLEVPLHTETTLKPSGEIPAGYITTTKPIEEQFNININMDYKMEEDQPSSLVVTHEKSLVVRRPKPKMAASEDGTSTVKNFKKFRKASYPGYNSLPRIIGGSDLEVHNNRPHREVEDWFQEQVQVDGKEDEDNSMANDLFNWEPKKKGRRR